MNPVSENDTSSLESSLDSPVNTETPDPTPLNNGPGFLKSKHILILTVLIIIMVVSLVTIAFILSHKKQSTNVVINTQSLGNGTLTKLEGGQNQNSALTQQLTVTPNTLFKNNVAVQGNLSVSGTTHLQSAVSIDSNLSAGGSLTVGGSATIGGNLSVSGLVTASGLSVGTLTISSLRANGDLVYSGHLVNSGLAPSTQVGITAGNGATVTISGNDTSGVVTITTGSNPSAGQLATITFRTAFKLTVHVQLTPINSDTAITQYYAGPAANSFTVNLASTPKPGTAYSFDYFVSQ